MIVVEGLPLKICLSQSHMDMLRKSQEIEEEEATKWI
jgi:hypothetical protein